MEFVIFMMTIAYRIMLRNISLFFEIQDIEDLKNKINEILNIDYNLYSNNAVNFIKKSFSAKLMSEKYQDFYEGACQ